MCRVVETGLEGSMSVGAAVSPRSIVAVTDGYATSSNIHVAFGNKSATAVPLSNLTLRVP